VSGRHIFEDHNSVDGGAIVLARHHASSPSRESTNQIPKSHMLSLSKSMGGKP